MNRKSKARMIFEIINYTFFTLFCISILVPFINAVAISLSSYKANVAGGIGLWPVDFDPEAYMRLIVNPQFTDTFRNTVFITVVNTVCAIGISLAAGYALANDKLAGRKIVVAYFMIPMYFSGGIIPTYLLVNNQLRLTNNFLALILPNIVSIFYIIIFRNMIRRMPKELLESAEIDGATQFRVLGSIIFPLIIPTVAAFIVFSAVEYWNEWFNCMLYIRKKNMWTLQYQLRDILISARLLNSGTDAGLVDSQELVHSESLKMAALMITILPIIVVYPFVQKYFMSGVLVGAVKG